MCDTDKNWNPHTADKKKKEAYLFSKPFEGLTKSTLQDKNYSAAVPMLSTANVTRSLKVFKSCKAIHTPDIIVSCFERSLFVTAS